jgi:hypothetical protein
MRLIPALLILAACSGGDSGAKPGACDVIIEETVPTSGALDAYYRADIEFQLSDEDPTASIETNITGHQETSEDGRTVKWVLDAPLDSGASYSATLSYCGGEAALDFTTSAYGEALTSDLTGRTFRLDLGDARIVEPAAVGDLLGSYLTVDILATVLSYDSEIKMIGGLATEGSCAGAGCTQDYCNPTIDFPPAAFDESPFFEIGPDDTTIEVAGYSVTIGDLYIAGTFAPDGTSFGGGQLAGSIDTRPLDSLVSDDTGSSGAICDLVVSFGVTCEPCPADGEPFCLSLVADQIQADEVAGVTLDALSGNNCTTEDWEADTGNAGTDACASWTSSTVPRDDAGAVDASQMICEE